MQYTRNDWYVACLESEIGEGCPVSARILNERIVVWRSNGKVVALEDRCVHRAAALSLGRCEGSNLRCMYHGILFDEAGAVVEIPGQDIIPANAKVRAYPVVARFGFVWVWMGDPAKADHDLLPRLFDGIDFNDYIAAYGVLDYDAEQRLISDNLLDFSHLPYVHRDSFKSPPLWAESPTKVKALPRGVRFERWTENKPDDFTGIERVQPVDEWLGYDYLLPGVLVMWVGLFPAGTARAVNYERPDFSQAVEAGQQIQPVTPTTERTSRYYFMFGPHRERSAMLHLADKIVEVIYQAFNEDKRMIEAQQRIIDQDPGRDIMPTVHDRGVVMYNRLKAKRVAEERGLSPAEADLAAAI
jgi:vanillate O-demethylase monooxygenase subunit